jgi:hypothetical protein
VTAVEPPPENGGDSSAPRQGTPTAPQILASNVPWFDAGGVLIIVALWWAGLTNLDGLEGYVQVLLIVVLLSVTVFFGFLMQQRFQWMRSTTPPTNGSNLLDRLSITEPTLEEYRNELGRLPEVRGVENSDEAQP